MALPSEKSMQPMFAAPSRAMGALNVRTGLIIAVAYLVFLVASFANGVWLIDRDGHAEVMDFVSVWAAGHLVLSGNAAGAYDWTLHKTALEQGVGHPFAGSYGWPYPPPFLFVAAILSTMPYIPALLAWLALTLPAYAAAIRAIIGHRIGLVIAVAFPGALWNIMAAQNGFLTAALLGSTLGALERRPMLAGVSLGLLSYKPQFGVLFPLVLVVGGHWRVFFAAAVTVLTLAFASWLAFGIDAWHGFFRNLPQTGEMALGLGLFGFQKLQSVFGVTRSYGGSEVLAWVLHGAVAGTCTIAVLYIWRRQCAYEIKAAALAVAVLLVTPYVFIYDLAALIVPMALLVRLGWRDGFLAYEVDGFALASGLILIFPVTPIPSGLCALLLVAALVFRRALHCDNRERAAILAH